MQRANTQQSAKCRLKKAEKTLEKEKEGLFLSLLCRQMLVSRSSETDFLGRSWASDIFDLLRHKLPDSVE